MISLSDKAKIPDGSTSKGNQVKFCRNGIWYKTDDLGYEGLAEVIASNLLRYTNIDNYATYHEARISYNGVLFNGCKSENFLPRDASLITAYRLFKNHYGKTPSELIKQEESTENKISCFINRLSKITGISEETIGINLTKLLEFDALILNNDRHFNNIPFILYDDGHYELGPIFDNGGALLSDTTFRPILTNNADEIEDYILKTTSKPFSPDFSDQVDAIRSLFNPQLVVDASIQELLPVSSIYDEKIISRCKQTLEIQFDKHPEMFLSQSLPQNTLIHIHPKLTKPNVKDINIIPTSNSPNIDKVHKSNQEAR